LCLCAWQSSLLARHNLGSAKPPCCPRICTAMFYQRGHGRDWELRGCGIPVPFTQSPFPQMERCWLRQLPSTANSSPRKTWSGCGTRPQGNACKSWWTTLEVWFQWHSRRTVRCSPPQLMMGLIALYAFGRSALVKNCAGSTSPQQVSIGYVFAGWPTAGGRWRRRTGPSLGCVFRQGTRSLGWSPKERSLRLLCTE
jgi:hypothetical protein